ncbi:MAG TPA: hypothetical protein VNH11_09065 [Pirellulales bacterium]|nr:hypothetical protein [Pirellulales bacterium]
MIKPLHGIVRGKTIELTDELGVADGQEVVVQVKVVAPTKKWGEGILRSAGAMAPYWTEEDDRILDEIYQDRTRSSRREIPE